MDMSRVHDWTDSAAADRASGDSSQNGMAMQGGSPPPSPTQTLEALIERGGPLLRLPEPAESSYLAEHRRAAVQLRAALCLLPAFLFCMLALLATPLLGVPAELATSLQVVGLGIVVPSSVIATAVVASAPERASSGIAVALNALVLVLAMEWLRARGLAAGLAFDHAIIACVPTALILFGGFRAACMVSIALGYLAATAAAAAFFDAPAGGAMQWLGESVLLLLVASAATWMESRQRRHWLMRRVIEHQAHRDPLTGLRNRRSFEQFYDVAASQARREHKNVCFAMVDLDHFKLINDRYGHAHGDSALQQVAALLAQFERRPLDAIARLGGEEFGVLLYDCNHASALRRLNDLAQLVHGSAIRNEGAPGGRLTMSIGGTISDGHAPLSALLDEADRRLYEVKHQGRNGVRVGALVVG